MDLLTAGVQVELDADLELDRQRRAEALKAKLTRMLAQGNGAAAIDQMMSLMLEMERTNDRLAWRVLLANRYRFGRSTEKLSRDELKQLYLVFGGDTAVAETQIELPVPAPAEPEQIDDTSDAAPESEAESESEDATPAVPVEPKKKKRKRVRSIQIAPEVERQLHSSLVSEEERVCALCGNEKKSFGCVEHQLITWVPAKIVVEVERREKLACQSCRKDVSVAPRSQTPNVVRRVDASLLAKLVDEKCALALPVDRQRRELARLGLDVPDKTLQSYWGYTTDLLEPIAVATLSEVFGSSIVGADDSHLKTLDKSRKHGVSRAHLWCFVGSGDTVGGPESIAYGYTPSWDATEIIDWFSAIDGFIQCDGYAGYSREIEDDDGQTLVAVPPERRLGCGMHIRSKFHAALLAKDGRASIPLKLFADLYKVEDDCKARGLDADARGEERRRRSAPLLEVLDDWVDKLHPKLLPKSPLRRATTYAVNQRPFFRRCFDDGRFEIDNGRVERRIRLFAVARRNFLFTGSARGGERLAIAFTLVDNCLAVGIEPHRYLVDVIGKIEAGWPMQRLSELIPHRWAAQQSAEKRSQQA
jgi:transposase